MGGADIMRLLDAIILNILLTNVDSHAKNYSIILAKEGATLAPLYDLMAGDAWPNITKNMAQEIGGKRDGRHILGRHWQRFATQCGLTPSLVLNRVNRLAEQVISSVDLAVLDVEAMPAGGHYMLDIFANSIRNRAKTVLVNLGRDDRDILSEMPDEGDDSELISPIY
jgi:serine/threonine-protein kinase HipA